MSAVFRREFKAFFTNPIGYVVMAVIFCTSGLFFFAYNMASQLASMTYVYSSLFTITLLVIPFLTMRLFSEEKRQKTDQALFTAPTGLTGIVLGKFLAAVSLFAIALSATLVQALVIALKVKPDWMVIIGNFVGLMLVAGMMIAIGLFISALTESQVIAALGTLAVSVILLNIDMLTSIFSSITWLREAINFFSIYNRYGNFTVGLIEYDNAVFFLSIQALFIFITVRVLDSRRWK